MIMDQIPSSSTMPLLRRALVCFYCNTKSAQTSKGPIRQFRCENCESTNYLDEKGNITDPPPEVTDTFASGSFSSIRYAQARASSPPPSSSPPSLFCDQCLSNQRFYTEQLANYLPPPDHPSYDIYVAAYEDHKRDLEIRYPQICEQCLPKVQEKLRANHYAANAEGLRRVLMQKKNGKPLSNQYLYTWRGAFYILTGLGWWASALAQVLWHAQGAVSDHTISRNTPLSNYACIRLLWNNRILPRQCFQKSSDNIFLPLVVGLVTIWWHPALIKKLHSSGGRMKGQKNYLQFQIVLMTLRCVASWLLQDRGILTPEAFSSVHGALATLFLLATIVSLRMVKIDYTPRFAFKEVELPPTPPSRQTAPPSRPTTGFLESSPRRVEPFPIHKLSADTVSVSPSVRSAVTTRDSSPESGVGMDLDAEEMDWTPTRRESIQLHPSNRIGITNTFGQMPQPSNTGISPFRGTLPPAPISPAHRLRNPPQRPGFKATPLEKQQDFFSNMMQSQGRTVPDTLNSGPRQTKGPELQLDPPKLQIREDPIETGLEYLFDRAFTVRDDPPEVQAAQEQLARNRVDWGAFAKMVLLWASPLIISVALVYGWSRWYETASPEDIISKLNPLDGGSMARAHPLASGESWEWMADSDPT